MFASFNRFITTSAIFLELNGFSPVIRLPSMTTFEVIGIKDFS